ncbi:isocitrate dehydrogenase [NAD] catalytic subunit 5, mitochondrial-like [Arachis stenosperma]|uniref:isocitrate dehydrogenase [NAD] catalytic subunit 5, mitochondrial-like n=1 Tax=Arachis stenosperma TaxID=217475 RepID=UPI0025AD0966|nr:isocitrate dehydrogenase [NAD] catalytic subunit 5, mitochondrial-like [Arachis stenosperma]
MEDYGEVVIIPGTSLLCTYYWSYIYYVRDDPRESLPGYKTRHDNVNLITYAEIQEYSGAEHQCCCEVAGKYPKIKYEEVVIDNCCMMLVRNPALFDVLVMPNLYGEVISDLCWHAATSGEGGIALAKAVHGSAPDIAEKNLANPTALLLSGVSMLRHLNLHDKADQIQNAILNTIAEGKYQTADLGGKAKTTEFTNTIIDHL